MRDTFTPPVTPRLGITVRRDPPRHPFITRHFRLFVADREIGVQSVSMPWLEDPDPEDGFNPQRVTLRRAVSTDRFFFEWRTAIAADKDDARDVTIVLLDGPDGKAIDIWRLRTAVPVRWTGPAFDAQSDDLAVEEIEVTYETIEWRTSV